MESRKKSFIIAMATIFALMLFTYVLTFIMECDGIVFYKWLLSPILVLGSNSGATTGAILVFLLVLGAVTNGLNQCGLMKYSLDKIVNKYGRKRYRLLFVIVFFFMIMGSLIGTFEEVAPLTPIMASLAIALGFDDLTGVSISMLAVGCGFAAGLLNPFTIGVAQKIVGLPMFSGVSLRILSFILIYALLMAFIVFHSKKVDRNIDVSSLGYEKDERMEKGFISFISIFSIALLVMFLSSVITVLQDYTLIISALAFTVAGVVSIKAVKTNNKDMFKYFLDGIIDSIPSILLILMASSIKYIMEESGLFVAIIKILESILKNIPSTLIILFIYLVCLIIELFIPSGSAKAFLLMPIIAPLATSLGISTQLCVLAFAFGDGFSNVLYPTNPALIISLSLTNMSYKKWFKHSIKFQAANLLLTSLILLFGMYIGY